MGELADAADAIVVGEIVEIRNIAAVRVARVSVEEVVKGNPGKDLWFLAQSTWTCDITGGHLHERAIFFLSPYEFDPDPEPSIDYGDGMVVIEAFSEPSEFRDRILEVTHGEPFWRDPWAGRGQMTIRGNRATVWTADVRLPDHLVRNPRKARYKSETRVPTTELLDAIKQRVNVATSN